MDTSFPLTLLDFSWCILYNFNLQRFEGLPLILILAQNEFAEIETVSNALAGEICNVKLSGNALLLAKLIAQRVEIAVVIVTHSFSLLNWHFECWNCRTVELFMFLRFQHSLGTPAFIILWPGWLAKLKSKQASDHVAGLSSCYR